MRLAADLNSPLRRTIAACAALLIAVVLAFAAVVIPGHTPAGPVAMNAVTTPPVSPFQTPSEPDALTPLPSPARPTELVVPSIGVRAAVQPLVVEGSTLTPPGDVSQVGWWSGGPLPGSRKGHVLITGHTVHTGGGVFNDLGRVSVGDAVRVVTDKGPMDYVVSKVRYLSVEQLAADSPELFALSGSPRLVLVTCAGWDGAQYHGNTVVIARPATQDSFPHGETSGTPTGSSTGSSPSSPATTGTPSWTGTSPLTPTLPLGPGLFLPEGPSYW